GARRRFSEGLPTLEAPAAPTRFRLAYFQEPPSTTVLRSISRSPARVRTRDRADGAATRGRGGHTPWRWRWRHAVQAAPGAPRGLKRLGRRGAVRKARGAGGESLARSAARKA